MSSAKKSSSTPESPKTRLPIRKIPGDYGLPLLGPLSDRLNFFYFQGEEAFFHTRISKYNSTVFRTNMPPGPFISSNSRVVAVLDAAAFSVLFDLSNVEKKDVLTGTFIPSLSLTGGHRVLAYLDPSEPKHSTLKHLIFSLLSHSRNRFLPDFKTTFSALFSNLETQLSKHGKSSFTALNDSAAFDFLALAYFGADPSDAKTGSDYPNLIAKWLFPQVCPVKSFGFLPSVLEDFLLHTFPFPSALVRSDYKKLYDFFYDQGAWFLDEAEKLGITREEACHNLLFAVCFNAYGGMKVFFPLLVKWVGSAGSDLHQKLAHEIRSAVESNGGEFTLSVTEKLPLTKSVVYEALRIEPPIPYQYAKAKKDLIIESHECAYEVKKDEMIFGFQPFATKDPKVFERAEEFVAERFVGEEGEKLLKYVLWSNGRETEDSKVGNKQCAGKDFVVTVSVLLMAEMFLRYDTFVVSVEKQKLGTAVMLTSVTKAGKFTGTGRY